MDYIESINGINNEQELNLLLKFIEIEKFDSCELIGSDFSKYWNISEFQLHELNEENFELFYKKWIEESGRENNMDEFGNLLFLQGMSPKWNKMTYRIILKEKCKSLKIMESS